MAAQLTFACRLSFPDAISCPIQPENLVCARDWLPVETFEKHVSCFMGAKLKEGIPCTQT